MRLRPLLFVLAVLTAFACQKRAADGARQLAPSSQLPAEVTGTLAGLDPEAEFADIRARTLPAVNGRVPSQLVAKLKFAPQFDAKNRVVALVPESWVMGDAPGMLKPPPDADLGAATSIAFGSACDGRCAPKDWAKSFDKVEVSALPVQSVDSDEPIGKFGRVIVARSGDVRYIVAGVWKPDSARYFYCRATLEGQAIDALQAFVSACRAMDVRRWE